MAKKAKPRKPKSRALEEVSATLFKLELNASLRKPRNAETIAKKYRSIGRNDLAKIILQTSKKKNLDRAEINALTKKAKLK